MNEAVLARDLAVRRRRREAARRKARRRRLCKLMIGIVATICITLMACAVHSGDTDGPVTVPTASAEAARPAETLATMPEATAIPIAAIVETAPEWEYMGEFRITHYCACERCCGKSPDNPWYGITATGTVATEGRTIAVDPSVIPYGSRVAVEYDDGRTCYYIAEDCGGAIKGLKVDVFIADHDRAWGLGVLSGRVYILNEE